MNAYSTVTMAWAAIHLYAAVYYGITHGIRRTDLEFRSHAFVCLGLSVFSVGASLRYEATCAAEAVVASRILFAGGAVVASEIVAFVMYLLNDERNRIVPVARAWAIGGFAANAAGLFTDPAVRSPFRETVWLGSELHTLALLPLGVVWGAGAVGLVAWVAVHIGRAARTQPDLRPVWVAMVVLGVFAGLDVVRLAFHWPMPYLTEHAAVFSTVAIHGVLLRRFLTADEELERRTKELRGNHDALWFEQEQHVAREQLIGAGKLASVIAHEIRNPLAVLKNAASGLRRRPSPEDEATLLEILNEEAERLSRLARDLRVYAFPVVAAHAELDVRRIVDAALDHAMAGIEPELIEVEFDCSQVSGPVRGDAELLQVALRNIMSNAIFAMPSGGVLEIVAQEHIESGAPVVTLRVSDTGEGMDTLVRGKALDPFFTTRAAGVGLGLAIVERVMHAHGGRVEVVSRFGIGTEVTLTIPQNTAHMTADVVTS
jgi:signal transduction histidine kinase